MALYIVTAEADEPLPRINETAKTKKVCGIIEAASFDEAATKIGTRVIVRFPEGGEAEPGPAEVSVLISEEALRRIQSARHFDATPFRITLTEAHAL
ncbi:MAG: hypothetical protein PHT12_05295 [Patescibacteria group bacterium]|nr:hypothetical protein [Patescibacteria group bacterium]